MARKSSARRRTGKYVSQINYFLDGVAAESARFLASGGLEGSHRGRLIFEHLEKVEHPYQFQSLQSEF